MKTQNKIQGPVLAALTFLLMLSGESAAHAQTSSVSVKQNQTPQVSNASDPWNAGFGMEDTWSNPFLEMDRMMQQMHRMFQRSMMSSPAGFTNGAGMISPRMDVQELNDKYVVKVDLPGMEKERINLNITENALTVSGERKYEKQASDPNGMQMFERSYGTFQRALPIPANVKTEAITAKYEEGVLTITMPKLQPDPATAPAARSIPIQ